MTTATLSAALMTASIRDNRIELRGPFKEQLNEFYGSLPGGRWDKKRGCWTCHITPACCWRITSQAPCRVEAEEKIRQLGHRFYEPVLRPDTSMVQPEIRNKDAWRHQVEAFHFALRREASLLAMAMGTGKSLVTVQLAENWRCRMVLILCPVSVRGVWRREFSKHAVNDWFVSVLESGTPAKKVAKAIVDMTIAEAHNKPWACVVNYETAKLALFAKWSTSIEWDLLVADESHRCFPRGTLVTTPQGEKDIAEIRVGDVVLGWDHGRSGRSKWTRVTHLHRSEVNRRDSFTAVGRVVCTNEHPIWTTNRGYVPASEITESDRIIYFPGVIRHGRPALSASVRILPRGFRGSPQSVAILQSVLQEQVVSPERSEIQDYCSGEYGADSLTAGCSEEDSSAPCVAVKSVSESQEPTESERGCSPEDGILDAEWRQRKGSDRSAKGTCRTAGMADGSLRKNESEAGIRIPDLLQNRHCESIADDRDRSRWGRTQGHEGESQRREEAGILGESRVAAVEVLEPRSYSRRSVGSGFCEVFNITTETENYFANGILVHNCKGYSSATSKYCAEVSRHAERRLALTGTPMAHSPLDLFGQFRFLDRGIYGDSYHRFRSMFAVSGPFGADHIVAFKNQEELARRMALITFHAGAEHLDLPDVTHIDIPFELGKESRRLYDEMEDDLIAFVKGGGEVTAANGLVKLLRLQQICSGFVEDDDKVIHEIGSEKRNTLADLLEDLNEPVVAFCVFHQQLDVIRHVAESLERRAGEISGRHKDLTPNALMPDDIDIMATQIRSGGVGIDLTRARVAVYYAPCYSLGDYDQSLSRLNRPGQTRPCVFYHLVGIGTVDEVIYKALEKKRDVVQQVVAYLKGEAA
ncbi:MAG TPA: SNF2-related protein [Bryobacteraceae bacterium]|nr:SNF2-related protein [Bryobacteraceae bacterium]